MRRSNGTHKGTKLVRNIAPGAEDSFTRDLIGAAKGRFFCAADGNGLKPWRSKGSYSTTRAQRDINPGPPGSHADTNRTVGRVGQRVFFAATRPGEGTELWVWKPTRSHLRTGSGEAAAGRTPLTAARWGSSAM